MPCPSQPEMAYWGERLSSGFILAPGKSDGMTFRLNRNSNFRLQGERMPAATTCCAALLLTSRLAIESKSTVLLIGCALHKLGDSCTFRALSASECKCAGLSLQAKHKDICLMEVTDLLFISD